MDTVTAEVIPPAEPNAWEVIPEGEYAIVELFGHTTLIGRIAEVERFGSKMLAIEPLFKGQLLGCVFHGGAAIYRLTPCSREIAWKEQPMAHYHLPPSIKATVPAALLAPPEKASAASTSQDDDEEHPF